MKSPGENDWQKSPVLVSLPEDLRSRVIRFASIARCGHKEAVAKIVERGLSLVESEFATANTVADLSPKQRAILRSLREGHSIKEIAGELAVSEPTVRTHIIRIRERLGCPDLLKLRMP